MHEKNMRQSPAFSDFRQLMDIWDNCCMFEADVSPKINMLLDGQNFIMFFTKEGQLYGCTEDGRLTFARMKHPDKDEPSMKDAHFSAINLYDALQGKVTENLFEKKDMKKMKLVSKAKCESLLSKKMKGKKANPIVVVSSDKDDRRPLKSED